MTSIAFGVCFGGFNVDVDCCHVVEVDVRWAEFDYGFAVFRLVGHHGVVNIY